MTRSCFIWHVDLHHWFPDLKIVIALKYLIYSNWFTNLRNNKCWCYKLLRGSFESKIKTPTTQNESIWSVRGALEKVMMAPLLSRRDLFVHNLIRDFHANKEGRRIEQGRKLSHRSFAALSDMGTILGAIHQVAWGQARVLRRILKRREDEEKLKMRAMKFIEY